MALVVLFVFPPFQKAKKLPSMKYYFKYLVFARSKRPRVLTPGSRNKNIVQKT